MEDLILLKVHPSQVTSANPQCVSAHMLNIYYWWQPSAFEASLKLSVRCEHILESDKCLQDHIFVRYGNENLPVLVNQDLLKSQSKLVFTQEFEGFD